MKQLDIEQGSAEWIAARGCYMCASEASAMLGYSEHMTRDQLLRLKALGTDKEFSEWAQKNLIERGHATERTARAIAQERIGQELYPVTATDDEGIFLASFDGLTMDETVAWEHKLWNKVLVEAVRAGDAPRTHWPQLEHQILLGGLDYVLFMVTDGTAENCVMLEYRSRPERRKELVSGWAQFRDDLKSYTPRELPVKPTGKTLAELPVLAVQLVGEVKASNLALYKDQALAVIASINRELTTDQHFADAELAIKGCKDAEERLALVKQQALEQTVSIASLFRTINELGEAFRQTRLDLDKLVAAKKESIREQIRQEGIAAFNAHIDGLNKRLDRSYLTGTQPPDFGGAMKGKKTIASLRDAMETTLARGKIAANELADRIQVNVRALRVIAGELDFLFPDEASLVHRETDAMEAIVKQRVAEHKAAEARREERIRLDEQQRIAAAAAANVPATAPAPVAAPAPDQAAPTSGPVATPINLSGLGAREVLEAWLLEYGKVPTWAPLAATIRAFLNQAGKKRKAA